MKTAIWQLQEAKNHFSEVVERARTQGGQTITKHGKPVVVMMSVEEFNLLEPKKPKAKIGQSLVKLLQRCPAPEIFDHIEKSRNRETARDLDLD
jgi:prevent-host-death family protein